MRDAPFDEIFPPYPHGLPENPGFDVHAHAIQQAFQGFGRIEVVANPIKLSETNTKIKMAPEFGQHTEEILLEMGYSWDDISKLKKEKVIN